MDPPTCGEFEKGGCLIMGWIKKLVGIVKKIPIRVRVEWIEAGKKPKHDRRDYNGQ